MTNYLLDYEVLKARAILIVEWWQLHIQELPNDDKTWPYVSLADQTNGIIGQIHYWHIRLESKVWSREDAKRRAKYMEIIFRAEAWIKALEWRKENESD